MLKTLAALSRPRISLAVALGSLCGAGYRPALHPGPMDTSAVALAALGAFLLTAGCSALNQVQERGRDARMRRTMGRPLPSGALSPARALAFALAAMAAGLACFALAGGWPLAGVGVLVVAVYNGAYTPLKPRTPLALLAGGVAGALPPVAGWLASGGRILDPALLALAGVFYLWQVPHFWLLMEKRRDDYRRAGFALWGRGLPEPRRRALLQLWVAAYGLGLGCLALAVAPGIAPMETLAPLALAPFAVAPLALAFGALAALRAGRSALASRLVDASLPLALALPLAAPLLVPLLR
jgi:protoheme IX farnesyltransferase